MTVDDERHRPPVADSNDLNTTTTRRIFLKTTLGSLASFSAVVSWAGLSDPTAVVIIDNSEGILIADTTRCVGCHRCELACTEYHEGRAQPTLARIKVSRNYNFGPRGQRAGVRRSMGEFGNFRLVQDTCLQCPHPVPCATACPHDAIVADPETKARVVDPERCQGCRICQRACPWEMMVFDEAAGVASKCYLCGGEPECVEACPSGALRYVSWRDLTRAIPIRQATLPVTKDYKSAGCGDCH
jgi:Fe-S-cluster-containing dehydrogenase component